jgi:hypothetical protein
MLSRSCVQNLGALLTFKVPVRADPSSTGDGEIMGRTKRKANLSSRELMQLTLWGGLLLVILLGLVYGLVRAGAIIPVGSGVEHHAAGDMHGTTPVSRP